MKRKAERRRAPRMQVEGLTASYWTGAAPCPRPVSEVGMAGAVIETDEQYCPGTLIRISLDAPAGAHERNPVASFALWARVVRKVPHGVCVEFVFEEQRDIDGLREFLAARQRRRERDPIRLTGRMSDERSGAD